MALSNNPEVENSIEDSLEEVKRQVEESDVNVERRSPDELIEQVDRLEEVVNGLRERQKQIAEAHSEDIHELEFGEAVEDSAIEGEIEKAMDSGVDLSGVEERLDHIEIAVEVLESNLDENMERLKDQVIEEAAEIDKQQLESIEEEIQRLDKELDKSKVEEQKNHKELDDRLERVEDRIEDINELKDDISSLEIGQDILESEIEGEYEDLRELLVEEVTGGFVSRVDEVEAEIDRLREELNFEKVDNLIDRQELEERINEIEEVRKDREEDLEEKILFLKDRISDSELEEKVDASRLENELKELKERLQEDNASAETVSSVESRVDRIDDRLDDVEEKFHGLAERDQEVVNDIHRRLSKVEEDVSESSSDVSREEFEEMQEKMEEMSDLLLKVAKTRH